MRLEEGAEARRRLAEFFDLFLQCYELIARLGERFRQPFVVVARGRELGVGMCKTLFQRRDLSGGGLEPAPELVLRDPSHLPGSRHLSVELRKDYSAYVGF